MNNGELFRSSAGGGAFVGVALANSSYALYGLSQVFKARAGRTGVTTTGISVISTPAIGDTHRRGETMEFEVTWSEAVTVRGTPRIGLAMDTHDRTFLVTFEAVYLRGSGTNKLVFGWEVSDRAAETEAVQLNPNPWRPHGAEVTAASDGSPVVWNLGEYLGIGGKADGSLLLEGGICGRTPQVRDAIVAAVSAASNCSQVTEAHLAGFTGRLNIQYLSIDAGDFAGLSGMTLLQLSGSGIETLPAGLFDGLDSVTGLGVIDSRCSFCGGFYGS